MSANDHQEGGDHYGLSKMQHWDIVALFELDYFQGQITKYVMRWKKKNGVQDLRKAMHFLEKYIELNEPPSRDMLAEMPTAMQMEVKEFFFHSDVQPQRPEIAEKPASPGSQDDGPWGLTYKEDVPPPWTIEGWFGDMTQMYKCDRCKRSFRATSYELAQKEHGDPCI